MFTGLSEEVGVVRRVDRSRDLRLVVGAARVLEGTRIGDSIMVNGSCLTVVETGPDWFAVELSPETVRRTTWDRVRPGARVNLERALALGDRLGGHLVQGHVDGTGEVRSILPVGGGARLTVRYPPELGRYLAEKGSVAVDGISLTIASLDGGTFEVAVIPHTWKNTALADLTPGSRVNLEVDLLARYLERLLAPGGVSRELLQRSGFF